jgi:hypothetical protein
MLDLAWAQGYRNWSTEVFGKNLPALIWEVVGVTSIGPESERWGKVWTALLGVELEICEDLMKELLANDVAGDFIEFGVFEGAWLNYLYGLSEKVGLNRTIWGMDSFEGLSKPHPEFDSTFWKEGSYAASLDTVRANVKADERGRFKFVKGFFAESLKRPDAAEVGPICWARIDCDIYEPALDSLNFLTDRLSHGAVLVFDDWNYSVESGEGKAFKEWEIAVRDRLQFEFLFSGAWGHFYVRCWHKDKVRYNTLQIV